MSKRDAEGFLLPDFPAKRQKVAASENEDDVGDLPDIDETLLDEDLDALLESADDVDDFTSSTLKKICLQFEKAISKNQELRIKFASDPTKFMQSEMELDSNMKELSILAVSPDLYQEFIQLGSLGSLVGLLTHENTDIANDVVSLLSELFDPFVISQHPGANCLIKAFMEQSGIDFLLEHMKRLDEKIEEEATGIYNALNVIENITEVTPETQDELVKNDKLTKFLIQKIKVSPIQQNQFYASEILSIIMTHSESAKTLLGSSGALEAILMLLAKYRKTDPESSVEEEIVENLFVCVSAAVSLYVNHKKFDELEGIQLMLIFIRRAMFCKRSALKIIDYQLNNDPEMCAKFVNVMGLKTLFAAFMKKSRKKKSKKYAQSDTEDEEHIIATIASLLLHTSGSDLQRVLHKFVEGDYLKVERLVELYEKNINQTRITEKQIELLKEERNNTYEDYNAEEDEPEFDLLRLESGLYALQMTCVVITFIFVLGETEMKKKLKDQISLQGFDLLQVYQIVSDYLEEVDNEKEKDHDRLRKAVAELYLVVKPE